MDMLTSSVNLFKLHPRLLLSGDPFAVGEAVVCAACWKKKRAKASLPSPTRTPITCTRIHDRVPLAARKMTLPHWRGSSQLEKRVFHCISDVSIQAKIGIFDDFTRISLILPLFDRDSKVLEMAGVRLLRGAFATSRQRRGVHCRKSHMSILAYPILAAKGVIHDNCMVSGGGLGVLPQKIKKIYSSNGAIWGISEQNFEAILARSGVLLCPSRGKLGHLIWCFRRI